MNGYKPGDVTIKNVERRNDFFSVLDTHPVQLKELHIFSHSIGGGLFLGYGDPILNSARLSLVSPARGRAAFYQSVLDTEKGTIFADDLVRSPVPPDGRVTVGGKKRYVGEPDILRLAPDVGTYREYQPH